MQLFAPRSFVSWPLRDDATVYLFQGVVRERERGAGVGAALLAALARLDAPRRRAPLRVTLPVREPVGSVVLDPSRIPAAEHTLQRTVDARMAWSAR